MSDDVPAQRAAPPASTVVPASSDQSPTAARLTRRRLLQGATAGLVVAAAEGCGGSSGAGPSPTAVVLQPGTPSGRVPGFDDPKRWTGRTLRVGAWGGEIQAALRDAVWEPFAAATGCTVEEVVTDYSQLRASLDQRKPYADTLVVDAVWAATALPHGYVQRLDDLHLDRGIATPPPVAAGSVPAFAYAMVGAYRLGAPKGAPPQTWAEWWDNAAFPGNRALQRGALGTFEFALLADGVDPAHLYPLDNKRAINSLKAISGKIVERWWDSGAQPVTWLGNGQADFASSWHYRAVAGQRIGLPVGIVWNQGLLVADHWVVPAGAPAADVARDFIRYATAAEVQAALARRVPLGPVNPAAFRLLDAATAAALPTSPANVARLISQDVAWWAANVVEANEAFNKWLLGVS